jgi:hypothetical protein
MMFAIPTVEWEIIFRLGQAFLTLARPLALRHMIGLVAFGRQAFGRPGGVARFMSVAGAAQKSRIALMVARPKADPSA